MTSENELSSEESRLTPMPISGPRTVPLKGGRQAGCLDESDPAS